MFFSNLIDCRLAIVHNRQPRIQAHPMPGAALIRN